MIELLGGETGNNVLNLFNAVHNCERLYTETELPHKRHAVMTL